MLFWVFIAEQKHGQTHTIRTTVQYTVLLSWSVSKGLKVLQLRPVCVVSRESISKGTLHLCCYEVMNHPRSIDGDNPNGTRLSSSMVSDLGW